MSSALMSEPVVLGVALDEPVVTEKPQQKKSSFTPPRFSSDDGFHAELKRRVHAKLNQDGVEATGGLRMILKTAVILAWFVGSYLMLLLGSSTVLEAILWSVSLALSIAGVGFAVQHDANHHAYSKSPVVNRIMSLSLDMLGAGSWVWNWKHNVFHHTYTNLKDADSDIDIGFLARLSPNHARYRMHRFQHLYLWFLYGLLMPKWHLIDDFQSLITGKISGMRFPRGKPTRIAALLLGKAFFFSWTLVIPMMLYPVWWVLGFYLLTWFIVGVALSVVFQLAHCVEEAEFPQGDSAGKINNGWAAHQVRTTVDFAQGHPVWTWYLGGLNYQIEHHLFPRISHLHYPRIAPVVREVCAEYGVPYHAHRTFWGALASHARWLYRMGREPAPATA